MRGKTFQRKTKKTIVVLGIFSDLKVDPCGLLEIFILFVFVLYLCLQA
jgi:hypothetical protein